MKDVFASVDDEDEAWASYPPFDERYLRAIEFALRVAWENLHKDPETRQKLSSQSEERISHLLRDMLNELRERKNGGVDDYNCSVFERPQIGAEVMTQDGKIRKPDVVFALSGWPRPGVSNSIRDGIFVECKILEQGSGKNLSAYCSNGIKRFVDGDYAAWMREGMMVAYVRTTQAMPNDLTGAMTPAQMREDLATDGNLTVCGLTDSEPRVYISDHNRTWEYLGNQGRPGPVQVRHLWLYVQS